MSSAGPTLGHEVTRQWPSGATLALSVGAITLLAVILNFHALGGRPLWFDEGLSLGCARLSWPDAAFLAAHEPVQWPFYMVLRFFLLFGNSETVIRMPSALFTIACVPLIFFVSRRLFGDLAGLVSAILVAVNADMVKYGQEARSYAMEAFLVIASVYVVCDYVERQNRRTQVLYVLLCTLAIYTHMYAVLAVLAEGISLLLLPPQEFPRRGWLQTYLAIFILTIPMWLFIGRIPRRETFFIPPLSLDYVVGVFNQISGFTGSLGGGLYLWVLVVALLCAVSAWRTMGRSKKTWAFSLPVLAAGLPMFIAIVAHSTGRPFMFERYMLVCIPGFALAAGALVAARPRGKIVVPLAVVFAVVGLFGVRNYFKLDYVRSEDYPELAKLITANAQPGDAIVFYWERTQIPYKYYVDRLPAEFWRPDIIYPLPGSFEQLEILTPTWKAPPLLPIQGHRRIWLVVHQLADNRGDPERRILAQALEARFRIQSLRKLPAWTVMLYSRIDSQGPRET